MLGLQVRIIVALCLLLPRVAPSADLGYKPQTEAARLSVLGDNLFRQSQFEDAESAYSEALRLDPGSVKSHLGMGKIAAMLSDRRLAARHYSAAYQAEPLNADATLAFASAVEDRESRRILLRNFLALAPAKDERKPDVRARLQIEERLGIRKVALLESPYQPYRIRLSNLRRGGLLLSARITGGSDLRLILDTGATGVALNASAGRNAGLEFLAASAFTGFGSASPTPARVALAASFETGDFKVTNLLVQVSDTELTADADGMIGLDVFEDFLIELNPHERRLDLTPLDDASATCTNCARAYRVGHLLLVHGEVNGHGNGYFIVDTGSPCTMISQELMPRSGRAATMTGTQGEQAVIVPLAPLTLRLGTQHLWGFEYATLDTMAISQNNGTAIAGAIGYSLLRDLSLTVNYRAGWVKLSK